MPGKQCVLDHLCSTAFDIGLARRRKAQTLGVFAVACASFQSLLNERLFNSTNVLTLCTGCHDKLHQQRYGARKHSQRITAIAARRARGASIGRPKKLMPHQCEEALKRLASGETMAALARSYGLSKSTVSRIVRSARLATNLS